MEMSPFFFGLYKLVKFALYPFTWLFLLTTVLMVLAFQRPTTSRLRWIRALVVTAFLVIFLLGNPIVARTLIGLIEQQALAFDGARAPQSRFHAIVVLGGGIAGKGSLRPSDQLMALSMERTICGADLFMKGFAPRLLLTGGDITIFGQGPLEAVEMKKLALRLGVPEGAIVLDTESKVTYDNAAQTKRILGVSSVLVVTSASHIPRATALFRKQGLDVTGYPCGYLTKDRPGSGWDGNPFDLIPQTEALYRSTSAITEIIGMLVYRVIGKL
jgi:uncharacterized SAM-binding protein YcdF (DUF218 family)